MHLNAHNLHNSSYFFASKPEIRSRKQTRTKARHGVPQSHPLQNSCALSLERQQSISRLRMLFAVARKLGFDDNRAMSESPVVVAFVDDVVAKAF